VFTGIADKETPHARYKDLALVEQDVKDMKAAHLKVRPVYVRRKERNMCEPVSSR
jgi:hypothetical protein